MDYIERTLQSAVLRASSRFKAILVTGMRQVGKSTMLEAIGGERTLVTLDHHRPLEIATGMREAFFEQYPAPVLIDEIQRAPGLFLEIKALIDGKKTPGLVWLAGSQRFELMKNVSESLSGRMATFELMPLSLYEIQRLGPKQLPYIPTGKLPQRTLERWDTDTLWEVIWRGMWPEVHQGTPEHRNLFFEGLLQTCLERDVRQTGVERLSSFWRFLVALASRIGQELQITKAAGEAGIAPATARQWLSAAEATGIIRLLPPFPEDVGKALVKKPKLYFTDTGLAAWLCGIPSSEALRLQCNRGAFFENFAVIELLKSWAHNGRRADFFFYRDAQQNGIDLVIRDGITYHPVEIKTTEHPEPSMVRAFDCIREKPTFRRGPGALICLAKEPVFIRPDVIAHSIFDI